MDNILLLSEKNEWDDCPRCWQNFVEHAFLINSVVFNCPEVICTELAKEHAVRISHYEVLFKTPAHKLLFELKWS